MELGVPVVVVRLVSYSLRIWAQGQIVRKSGIRARRSLSLFAGWTISLVGLRRSRR